VLVLVVVFAVRGLFRGLVGEVFAVLGLLAGLATAGWVSHWVGARWGGAQPALAFLILRWLLVVFSGLAVAGLLGWSGQSLRGAVRATPAGWLDGSGGLLVGATLGIILSTFAVLGAIDLPAPRGVRQTALHARVTRPLLWGGAQACAWGVHRVPGSEWLRQRFLAAARQSGSRSARR